jgi:hypothetical protein
VGAEVAGELDGQVTDASGRGVHKDVLAGLDVGDVDQCLVGGGPGQRQRGRGQGVQPGRDRGQLGSPDGGVLGVGAAADVGGAAQDPVADSEAVDGIANGCDGACQVSAEHQRQLVGHESAEVALADLPVQRVDAGSVDAERSP